MYRSSIVMDPIKVELPTTPEFKIKPARDHEIYQEEIKKDVIPSGTIYNCSNAGLSLHHGPKSCQFPKYGAGTTYTIFGNKKDDFKILLENIYQQKIFEYFPQIRYKNNFYVTVVTERDGFRVFDHGEDAGKINYFGIEQAAKIILSAYGMNRERLAFQWPRWAVEYTNSNVRKEDFDLNGGAAIPNTFDLTKGKEFGYGHWVTVTGEVKTANFVHIELGDDGKTPIRAKFRVMGEPFLEVDAIRHGVTDPSRYSDSAVSRDTSIAKRFTVAFVCEELGWKIYVNGEEFHFFYHRWSPSHARKIQLYGNSKSEGGWKLMKLTWKH